MATVKKLSLGNHKTDDGKNWTGYGWAVVNEKEEIYTWKNPLIVGRLLSVYNTKKVALLDAKKINEGNGN